MRCLERHVREVRRTMWHEMEELERKFTAVERRLGFPPKRYWRVLSGVPTVDSLIVEREWPSVAEMEAGLERALADPEWKALSKEGEPITSSIQVELYYPAFDSEASA